MTQRRKIRLGVLFGGRSAEHEVSLLSAKSIVDALDKEKYELFLIGIEKNGEWKLREAKRFLDHEGDLNQVQLQESSEGLTVVPQDLRPCAADQLQPSLGLDVIFPVLHGTYGEDGTVQGLLKLANIPFVGASVLGSAVGMDKDVMKRLLRDAGIPIARFVVLDATTRSHYGFETLVELLGLPFFVKPANLGSSIGVSKVKSKEDFLAALDEAFLYDRKVLVEEFIAGREIECAILGNDQPIASLIAEVVPQTEFHSYEAKYLESAGTHFEIPVALAPDVVQKVQELCIQAFRVLCCEGMARVDCFLTASGEVIVNEINTIPGFTKTSVYPRLWEASGLPCSELLDRLIALALERHQIESQLQTSKLGAPCKK